MKDPGKALIVGTLLAFAVFSRASLAETNSVLNKLSFPEHWIDGTGTNEPAIQVHALSDKTWIIRQSIKTHYEAPFLYVLQGATAGLLWDTGAKGLVGLQATVDRLIGTNFPLIVAHSHAHDDHTAGDSQFSDRSNTQIVAADSNAISRFFRIQKWPETMGNYDLGGRSIKIIPIPGHEASHIALYDSRTRILLTGDTLYPGRLYIQDQEQFRKSINRLVDFARANPVSWLLGNHVEMTRVAGQDYARRATAHPNELPLQMTVDDLRELQRALGTAGTTIKYKAHAKFILVPEGP